MLVGTADVAALARHAPTVERYFGEPIVLREVALFQIVMEMRRGAREAVLPPSLHPTIPPALSMQVWQVGESPWGAFRMAVSRVSCRSGVRARGFTTGAAATTEAAVAGLRGQLGYPARVAEIDAVFSYSGAGITVRDAGHATFRASAIDPTPLDADDVQYTGTLNLAQVPTGLRLMQVEFHVEAQRVERLRARLQGFDAAAWGNERLDPYH
ncbi:MAG TPA: hypothetical protein VF210_08095, partial [Pseudomonadales bacterium]